MYEDILYQVYQHLKNGDKVVQATIIKTSGFTPRKAGSFMFIINDSKTIGSIGGGTLEYTILKKLQDEKISLPATLTIKLDQTMSCSGTVEVFLNLIKPTNQLVIYGLGNIGLHLAKLAKLLDFYIIAIDNREEILNNNKDVCDKIFYDFNTNLDLNEKYVVICTYNHLIDAKILKKALNYKVNYIALVCSKSKRESILNFIKKENLTQTAKYNLEHNFFAPAGIKQIGSRNYKYIALSIIAQIASLLKDE